MLLKALKVNKVPLFALKPTAGANISHLAMKVLGASYEKHTDTWFFPAYYPFGITALDDLQLIFPNKMQIDASVWKQKEILQKSEKILQKNKINSDFKFKTTPMDHQIEGLLRGILFLRLGLFFECGAGKTKVAIDLMRYLKHNTLFLCPSRLVENALDELEIHAFPEDFRIYSVRSKDSKDQKIQVLENAIRDQEDPLKNAIPFVLIIGYETLSYCSRKKKEEGDKTEVYPYFDLVTQLPYELAIFDESHKLRSINSKRSTMTSKAASKAYRRVLMTGTPSLGNPLHLYVQMRVLMPWMYTNYFAFKNKFVQFSKYDKRVMTGFKNLHILRRQIETFALQKTKEECMDLPERQVILKNIPMSQEQKDLYEEIRAGLHTSVSYNPMSLLLQMKLHQVCGGTLVDSPIDYDLCNKCDRMARCVEYKVVPYSKGCIHPPVERARTDVFIKDNPKLDFLMELLDTIVNGEGKKAVLWYRYKNEQDLIFNSLEEEGIKFLDYKKMGHAAVTEFQNNPEPCVFVSQIQNSSGITLTAGTYTIYYSLTFDLEHYLQSRDRIYRKGQDKKTTEYHLTMKGSIDHKISKALQIKMDVIDALFRQDLDGDMISKIDLKK